MNAVGDAIGNAGLAVLGAGHALVQSAGSEERESGKDKKAGFKSALAEAAGAGFILFGWVLCMASNAINTTALRFFPPDEHEEFTDDPLQIMGFFCRDNEMADLNSIFD